MPNEKTISANTIDLVESIFTEYSGFKKSEVLRRKIHRVIEGKAEEEVLAWVNEMLIGKNEYELASLAEDLTNNETFFFRDITHFNCLTNDVLPKLIKSKIKKKEKEIRLWSAASSTGEEAYSLAIVAVEFMVANNLATMLDSGRVVFKDGWSLKVFGTDISKQVIRIAQNGIYSTAGLSPFRSLPAKFYAYFDRQNNVQDRLYAESCNIYKVKENIRKLVYFDRHNLVTKPLPLFLQNMDIIFCRNLLIYIDPESQKQIQSKLYDALSTKGYLFLSAVDNLQNPKLFNELRFENNFIYQKN